MSLTPIQSSVRTHATRLIRAIQKRPTLFMVSERAARVTDKYLLQDFGGGEWWYFSVFAPGPYRPSARAAVGVYVGAKHRHLFAPMPGKESEELSNELQDFLARGDR